MGLMASLYRTGARAFLGVVLALAAACGDTAPEPTNAEGTPRERAFWTSVELVRTGASTGVLEIANRTSYELYVNAALKTSEGVTLTPTGPVGILLPPRGRDVPVFELDGISLDAAWEIQPIIYSSPGDPALAPSDAPYRLPYGCDATPVVTQSAAQIFTHSKPSETYAVDFSMPVGTPIVAMRGGRVVEAHDDSRDTCVEFSPECNRMLNYVVVQHEDTTIGEYLHLEFDSVLVEEGHEVVAGQPLARSGNSGFSTAPHLHVGVMTASEAGLPVSVATSFRTTEGVVETPAVGATYHPEDCLDQSVIDRSRTP